MYRVLLVDDERIIREGIAHLIDWENQGLVLVGAAADGRQAAEMIESKTPDIVITDVKMPDINGIELIAMENKQHPEIVFVVLSGYGEFELASAAMHYGVKHYLLKPCNEQDICNVLQEVTDDLQQRDRREKMVQESQEYLSRMLPLMQNQFLQELTVNGAYQADDVKYYCRLLHLELKKCRVILFQAESGTPFEDMYILRNIVSERLPKECVQMSSILIHRLLVILNGVGEPDLAERLDKIRTEWLDYGRKTLTVTVSSEVELQQLPQAYREAERYLRFAFYLGDGGVITPRDVTSDAESWHTGNMIYNYEPLAGDIKSGNVEAVKAGLNAFFEQLRQMAMETNMAKAYCIELFLTVERQCDPQNIQTAMKKLPDIQQMHSIDGIQQMITQICVTLADGNNHSIRQRHSRLVQSIIEYVNQNLSNPELSLKWLSNHVFFMNVGYLGRLFCHETGEKFSSYLLRVRIEHAKQLIGASDDERVYEVANQVGFANNSQYFSQLFKKSTGCTPSEYKSLMRDHYQPASPPVK